MNPRTYRMWEVYCHGRTLEECYEMRLELEAMEEVDEL